MSSFLFSASITLTLLSILSVSTAILVDTDGEPVTNGGVYYIIPKSATTGLTYTIKRFSSTCPLYITKDPTNSEYSPGTPVKISSPAKTTYISLDEHVDLAFQADTPCGRSPPWGATINEFCERLYITMGSFMSIVATNPFFFTKTDNDSESPAVYELKFALGSSPFNVGLYEDDGLLGTTPKPNTKVSFKKAFYDGLKLSSTA